MLLNIAVSLLPVLVFLAALILMDSYKLLKVRSVLLTLAIGVATAVVALLINGYLLKHFSFDIPTFSRYIAPIVEEGLKSIYVVILIWRKRVGFMVDAALVGFAIGTGFALVENIYYLSELQSATVMVWIVRGFGTAAMHGTTTAIFAVLAKHMFDRHASVSPFAIGPALLVPVIFHSLFNHFILPPLFATLALLIVLPPLFMFVFDRSEKMTRHWLGVGMDADTELLEMITSGLSSESRVGRYLDSLRGKFSGTVLADMLCYLRIYLELAVRAKGILMMRESGFEIDSDPNIVAKLEELKFLEKSIGRTGKLAMNPFLQVSSHDLWQIYSLK